MATREEILDLMRQQELAISDLYSEYALKFPKNAGFWRSLSEEEAQHARWVEGVSSLIAGGQASFSDLLPVEAIEGFVGRVREETRHARRGGLTPMEALTTARDIESSILESTFFEKLKGTDPDLVDLRKRLIEATKVHRKRIDEAVVKQRKLEGAQR